MILGVGLGAPVEDEFGTFGETTDLKEIAACLDEGLEALNLLWSGKPVRYHGAHVVIDDVTFLPTPVQRPRVPIMRSGAEGLPPQPDAATVAEISAFLRDCRAEAGLDSEPFDLLMCAMSPANRRAAADLAGSLAQAGATWWAECKWDDLESADPMFRRVDQGPPRP
jgi:alkanesulfonate monooxygenase SsuD/methylene tetrahydromethanopterin reductase-like flavin-dependent oxidoreductase (luciferase family)